MLDVTVQALTADSAERRWNNALRALDPSRYPGLRITQTIEPYWIEEEPSDNNSQ